VDLNVDPHAGNETKLPAPALEAAAWVDWCTIEMINAGVTFSG